MAFKTQLLLLAAVLLNPCSMGVSQESPTGAEWVDSKQLLTIEISDLEEVIRLGAQTDLFASDRWNEIFELITDESNGLISKANLKKASEAIGDVLSKVEPGNLVCSIDSSADWQIVVRADASDFDQQLGWLVDQSESICQLLVGEDSESGTAASEFAGENVFQFGSFLMSVKDNWIVVTNDEAKMRVAIARIEGTSDPFKKLSESRKYLTVRKKLGDSRMESSSQIDLHLDPQLVWILTGWLNEEEQRAWGANEILASGMSVNLVPSKGRNDRSEIVFDAFILAAEPRVGISAAIELKGSPNNLPPLPERVIAFSYINMDWKKFAHQRRELYDLANGKGSYLEFRNNSSRMAKLLGEAIRQKQMDAMGTVRGQCWFKSDQELKTLAFKQINDTEQQISAIELSTEKGSELMPDYGFFRDEIRGYPAMLSNRKFRGGHLGMVFMDDWVIQSDDKTLDALAQQNVTQEFPQRVEEMIKRLVAHSSIKDDRSIVFAMFPEGWNLVRNTMVGRLLREKLVQEARKTFPGDLERVVEEYERLSGDWENFKLKPKSKAECRDFVKIGLGRLLSESFGSFILIGNDNGKGLRFSAMSIPKQHPSQSEK